jgi:hypothetical protein
MNTFIPVYTYMFRRIYIVCIGTVIKEAFIFFYFCLAVGIMMSSIDIEHRLSYLIRSLFLCVGSTGFCLRLLINRCVKYWIPEPVQRRVSQGYEMYKAIWPIHETVTSMSANYDHFDDDDCPIYQSRSIQMGDINELIIAIEDPARLEILRKLALKVHYEDIYIYICIYVYEVYEHAYTRIVLLFDIQ